MVSRRKKKLPFFEKGKKMRRKSETNNGVESHNPQPPAYNPAAALPQPPAAPQLPALQPPNMFQQLSQLPAMGPQLPEVLSGMNNWQSGYSASHIVSRALGSASASTGRTRYLTRIQAAA